MIAKINKNHTNIQIFLTYSELEQMQQITKNAKGMVQFKYIDKELNSFTVRYTKHNEVVVFKNNNRVLVNNFYPIKNSIITIDANGCSIETVTKIIFKSKD